MKMNNIRLVLAIAMLSWSNISMAAVEAIVTKVDRLLVDTERYGQCMIYTKATPTNDCPSNWFSLDCEGSFYSKEKTRRLWDSAQLAYATEARVVVYANDQQKHNGYCVVARLDVVR